MSITIAIFLGLSLAVVFLFFYMFARDKAIDKKFHLISAALENINQEIYKIQKQQKDNSLQNIENLIADQLDGVIENLIETIKQSQYKNQKEIEMLFDKISKLESNVKTMSLPNLDPIANKKDNKEKAKELFEIGYSIEEIAKELGMPAGEVQLLIKF
jgi:predicted transcriptional regulator